MIVSLSWTGIRNYLLDSDDHQCPECKETGVSPDTLIPNRFLRGQAIKFKNECGSFKITENNVRSPVINKSDNEDNASLDNDKTEIDSEKSSELVKREESLEKNEIFSEASNNM